MHWRIDWRCYCLGRWLHLLSHLHAPHHLLHLHLHLLYLLHHLHLRLGIHRLTYLLTHRTQLLLHHKHLLLGTDFILESSILLLWRVLCTHWIVVLRLHWLEFRLCSWQDHGLEVWNRLGLGWNWQIYVPQIKQTKIVLRSLDCLLSWLLRLGELSPPIGPVVVATVFVGQAVFRHFFTKIK